MLLSFSQLRRAKSREAWTESRESARLEGATGGQLAFDLPLRGGALGASALLRLEVGPSLERIVFFCFSPRVRWVSEGEAAKEICPSFVRFEGLGVPRSARLPFFGGGFPY